jgi:hypothetical protein
MKKWGNVIESKNENTKSRRRSYEKETVGTSGERNVDSK